MLLLFSACHLSTLCSRSEELRLNNKTVLACIGCLCFFLHGNIHVIFREIIKKKKSKETPAAVSVLEAVNFADKQKEI